MGKKEQQQKKTSEESEHFQLLDLASCALNVSGGAVWYKVD